MGEFLAVVLGLPDSAPRRIRQGATTILIVVALLAPQTYAKAVTTFVHSRVDLVIENLLPTVPLDTGEEVMDMAKSSGKPGKAALSKAGKALASNGTSKAGKSKAGSTLGKG